MWLTDLTCASLGVAHRRHRSDVDGSSEFCAVAECDWRPPLAVQSSAGDVVCSDGGVHRSRHLLVDPLERRRASFRLLSDQRDQQVLTTRATLPAW